jgi:TatD DNase family protein
LILTDTHTHLYSQAFDDDRQEVIQEALKSNIKRFFIPAIDSETTNAMYALEKAYPENIFLMMGLHPTSVQPKTYLKELQHVENQFKTRDFYAVGEIGIDLYWDKSTLGIQQEAFHRQIELAKAYELPIVIHCREAFDEVFEVLEQHKGDDLHGIFHCFTGNYEQAMQAISYNMHLGIGGVVTFKNGKIDQFLNQIDLKHIVLETDSPYLTPKPYRGKRNQSAYLTYIAEKLAEIYSQSLEQIAEITTANSKRIFGV